MFLCHAVIRGIGNISLFDLTYFSRPNLHHSVLGLPMEGGTASGCTNLIKLHNEAGPGREGGRVGRDLELSVLYQRRNNPDKY